MKRCIRLAAKAGGQVWSNPMVGCVIVHKGKIIGEGYHKKFGEPHAEVNAIASVKNKKLLSDSTLYVNLEPCSHFGKTPPCVDLIIKHNIPKVVTGMLDPNPLVAGSGFEKLLSAGVDVVTDVEKNECEFLNRKFITHQKEKRPYVVLKWAQTFDGFMAPENLKRTQITGADANKEVHQLRSWCGAVLVGFNTALIDDPKLTVRNIKAPQIKFRVVIDEKYELPQHGNLFNGKVPTLIFNSIKNEKQQNFTSVKIRAGKFLITDILKQLHKLQIPSLLVEGGAATLNQFLSSGIWDEAHIFVSRKKMHHGLTAPTINKEFNHKIKSGSDTHFIYFNN